MLKLLTTQYKRLTNCFLNADRRDSLLVNVWDCYNESQESITEHKVTGINTKLTLTYLAVSHIVLMVKKRLPIIPHFSRRATWKKNVFVAIPDARDLTKMVVRWKRYKRTICFCSLINWFSNLTLKYT